MANKITPIQSLKGIHDIVPTQMAAWVFLEQTLARILNQYGYDPIRLPYLEYTELFKRSMGEVTDVVEKEMYSFTDVDGQSVSLRPEGTAGCVRAGIENGLLYHQVQRLWYTGPMFRREKPQKGRYRQFYQLGAEVFGLTGPDIDAEMLLMTWRMWQQLGLDTALSLQINSLGTASERQAYSQQLQQYLRPHQASLDADSKIRLERNPLRILDSKAPEVKAILAQAPQLSDCLGAESRQYFTRLTGYLDELQVPYQINPYLVRGLDYYCHLVFEWVTAATAAQNTVCAGGRYDGLVAQLGGHATPAVGFALGMERILMLLPDAQASTPLAPAVDGYWVLVGEKAEQRGWQLMEQCRDQFPTLRWIRHCGGGSFKSQFQKADKSGATLALVLGEDEVANGTLRIKFLRHPEQAQHTVPQSELIAYLQQQIFLLKWYEL